MSEQITIEDMDGLVEALRYSQTLVNTAGAGVDLSFDYLRSYDYYGAVRMTVSSDTVISAQSIALSDYTPAQFYQYSEGEMSGYFYKIGDAVTGATKIEPITELSDNSLLTTDMIDTLSVMNSGNVNTEKLDYIVGTVFDVNTDSRNTLFPISTYDSIFFKASDTIPIDSSEWSLSVYFGYGSVKKDKDETVLKFSNTTIDGGVASPNISFSSTMESKEEILRRSIREDGVIDTSAKIPEEAIGITNIFTLRALEGLEYKKFGDELEIHLENTYTDAELKAKVDSFMETSGSDLVYSGEDAFLTLNQANMLADYIYRKVTAIEQSSIQI